MDEPERFGGVEDYCSPGLEDGRVDPGKLSQEVQMVQRRTSHRSGEMMAESTPGSFLKKCKWCSAELPIAAERCYECGKAQK